MSQSVVVQYATLKKTLNIHKLIKFNIFTKLHYFKTDILINDRQVFSWSISHRF